MSKLIMLRGLPGSGKSTWAKQMLKDNPGQYKRVNRDEIRAMVDNGHWSQTNERFIRTVRDLIIIEALAAEQNVIIDDTNLDPSLEPEFRRITESFHPEFEVVDLTEVDKDLCIKRDLMRQNSVGSKVINRMYNQYIVHKETLEHIEGALSAIICDIDGTLAHMKDRGPFDWSKVGNDTPDHKIIEILHTYQAMSEVNLCCTQTKIILFSGRDGSCREETEKWLKDNLVDYDELYMRTADDVRKDSIIKRELFDTYIKGKYNVTFVLDDRDQVVQMWRNMGLTCLQVAEGDF
jgi:predicted kinase